MRQLQLPYVGTRSLLTEEKLTTSRPIGVDLFAGAGGMSLGFEQAGFDVVAAVEIDPIHAATHSFNFPNCATICRSVIGLSAEEIRAEAGIGTRSIDVVFGGAPCQGFSLIGKRAIDDPRNKLVHEFVRIVVELRAKYFVFENVKGLTLGKHRRFLSELINEFRESGYNVLEPYEVLNAARFGVPQDRRRLFLMGALRGLPLPKYPAERQEVHVKDALCDLPDADEFDELLYGDEAKAKFARGSTYSRILRGIEEDQLDFACRRNSDPTMLTSSARTEHTKLSTKRFEGTKPGDTEPISRFHRLDPAGFCNTLRAGTDSARGAFTSPRPIHPSLPRVITVREAARLHSYPDWFRFHSTKWHGFRQIGNSVPPLLARSVASSIVEALGIEPKRPETPMDLGDKTLLYFDMSEAARYFDVPRDVIAQRVRLAKEPDVSYAA
jgi:DNA (cytosine-5)-methyltransferase 1